MLVVIVAGVQVGLMNFFLSVGFAFGSSLVFWKYFYYYYYYYYLKNVQTSAHCCCFLKKLCHQYILDLTKKYFNKSDHNLQKTLSSTRSTKRFSAVRFTSNFSTRCLIFNRSISGSIEFPLRTILREKKWYLFRVSKIQYTTFSYNNYSESMFSDIIKLFRDFKS